MAFSNQPYADHTERAWFPEITFVCGRRYVCVCVYVFVYVCVRAHVCVGLVAVDLLVVGLVTYHLLAICSCIAIFRTFLE